MLNFCLLMQILSGLGLSSHWRTWKICTLTASPLFCQVWNQSSLSLWWFLLSFKFLKCNGMKVMACAWDKGNILNWELSFSSYGVWIYALNSGNFNWVSSFLHKFSVLRGKLNCIIRFWLHSLILSLLPLCR